MAKAKIIENQEEVKEFKFDDKDRDFDPDKHVLIKKFLAQHSLVESNIVSFNDFIDLRMSQIVTELNETTQQDDIEIRLGKIRVGKPNITEADGSERKILPAEARLRNLTYSAPIHIEMTINFEGTSEHQEVEIGRIPIIAKSKYCHLHDMPKEQLVDTYNDPLDPGGYFIINGNEKVIVMIEDLAPNQPFIEKGQKNMLRLFSQRGAYRIPTSVTETNEGIIETSFSRFKGIPAIVLLKALGMLKDAEIARIIGKESDSLIVNFYEFLNIQTQEDAMLYIAEKTGTQGTKKEMLDRVKQRIDSYFLPHIGTKPKDREEKSITLCKLMKQYINSKSSSVPSVFTDKDHYANKRVRLSGDLLADLFRVNLAVLVRDIRHNLQKLARRKKIYSIKTLAKSSLFTHRIESAIATGSWIGERTGVTQNMDKTNYLAILSQLQRVSSLLPGEQENFLARTLHPTHYGRFCPIETPEGTEIGLRKNLALLSRISTAIKFEDEKLGEIFRSLGMKKLSEGEKGSDVFHNGKFIGSVENPVQFVEMVKEKRRNSELPIELSVRYDSGNDFIILSTDVGRVLRPLVVVKDGRSTLKREHLELMKKNVLSWNDLIKKGIIEYVDASEEENLLVALLEQDIIPEHTHLEVDEIDLLGLVTSLVPFGNHDQSSRLNRGSKTQKQALGLYASNYLCRLDTDVSILHYPQKPIVRSFIYNTLNIYPAGQNVVVAILAYEGYNVEDALVMNKGSVDRGLGRSTYFRPYSSTELNYAGGLADEICIPSKDTSGYRLESAYKFLEDDGIVYPEANMNENDVVIGKTSPPKFLSEAGEIAIKARKESSTAIRQEEKAIIDTVFITQNGEGNKVVQVRTRDHRTPEIGDKFSTAHGQKGVIGLLVPEEDMPFTTSGIKPDIIFNPHSIPGRMTVGYLIELLAGKVGSLSGKIIDGTIFSSEKVENLEKILPELGFRFDGKETLFNGITGKMYKAKIYIGNMYYLKLKYMVANKIHARASGKVTLLTRQPIEGRSKGGALRLGEMEQQALVAHGASLLLKERYDSDKVVMHICEKCGTMAIRDNIHNKIYCPICQTTKTEAVEISYAFRLLMEELLALHILPHFELKNKYE
ncbi:DNA-directed RNA polymerase subunit B'' [Candidatus Pacearchaeota archaeon]|nr:DNA-directed RNA polymerase subunit B'' [Candidatus Pacearchaeota archaeon]